MVTIKKLINAENTRYWQSHYKFCRDIKEWWRFTSAVFYLIGDALRQCYNPPGGTPHNDLYGEAPPERGILFRLLVCERVGESVIWVCERAQRANMWILWLYKVEKTFLLLRLIPIQMTVHLQQLKGMQNSKQGMCKGYYLSLEGIRKEYLFREKWYIKG